MNPKKKIFQLFGNTKKNTTNNYHTNPYIKKKGGEEMKKRILDTCMVESFDKDLKKIRKINFGSHPLLEDRKPLELDLEENTNERERIFQDHFELEENLFEEDEKNSPELIEIQGDLEIVTTTDEKKDTEKKKEKATIVPFIDLTDDLEDQENGAVELEEEEEEGEDLENLDEENELQQEIEEIILHENISVENNNNNNNNIQLIDLTREVIDLTNSNEEEDEDELMMSRHRILDFFSFIHAFNFFNSRAFLNSEPSPPVRREINKDPVPRKEIVGNCPICLDPMSEEQKIAYCRYGCGNNVHHDCFKKWKKETCVMCREYWG